MIPTRKTLQVINDAVQTSTIFWPTDPVTVISLVISPFVPGPDVSIADLTQATFDGSSQLSIPTQPQIVVLDNETGRLGILLKEPVGGYKWVCTADPDPAQIVYGYAVYSSEDDVTFFTELLPSPVTISSIGNFVELSGLIGYLSLDAYGNLPPTL
jgi:hypothetical protein